MNNNNAIITESEKNAVFTVLTPEECLLLRQSLNDLRTEYKEKKSLELSSLTSILGQPPVIPNTHDTDAMLEAADDKAKYGEKVKSIENFILYSLQHD